MRVLSICGSLRDPSTTATGLARALEAVERAGAETRQVSLATLNLPWCDGRDDESSYGGDAAEFKRLISQADALLIGSPEYHGSMTGTLKNALDLLGPDHLRGTMVGLLATAGGSAGAMNTLNHLRHVMRWMNAWVLPMQVSIPRAHEAFGEDGSIQREGLDQDLDKLGTELVRYAGLLAVEKS